MWISSASFSRALEDISSKALSWLSVEVGDTSPMAGGPHPNFRRLRGELRSFSSQASRYGMSAFGPLSVSGAHFLITLMLLHWLTPTEFGQFSFMLIVVGLGGSLTTGLLGAPLSSIAHAAPENLQNEINTFFKSSLVLGLALGFGVAATMFLSGANPAVALLFGIYAGAMSLRLFARTYAYSLNRVTTVVLSDCIYSAAIMVGLVSLIFANRVQLALTGFVMVCSAGVALVPFGISFVSVMAGALRDGSVWAYRYVWRDLTRWSVLGVVTTEMTINAHAYLVTFISGSRAFALLALGALFKRPFSLIASALPDQERPAMARSIAGNDPGRALRIAREYLLVIAALWVATLALAIVVLGWFPGLVAKKGFDHSSIIAVVAIWAAIAAVRGLRASDAVLLQAAREFKPLADAGVRSSVVALVATFALLMLFGPVASLGGILLGDLVMWFIIIVGVRKWKASAAIAPLLEAQA
jgi:O-antigen/teichoic acid export membrane protein